MMSYKEEVLEGVNFDNVMERIQDVVFGALDKVLAINYKKYLKQAKDAADKAKGAVEAVVDSEPVQHCLNEVKAKFNLGSQTADA